MYNIEIQIIVNYLLYNNFGKIYEQNKFKEIFGQFYMKYGTISSIIR
jgi:hypothetical protein